MRGEEVERGKVPEERRKKSVSGVAYRRSGTARTLHGAEGDDEVVHSGVHLELCWPRRIAGVWKEESGFGDKDGDEEGEE